jgi:hypothetical protein
LACAGSFLQNRAAKCGLIPAMRPSLSVLLAAVTFASAALADMQLIAAVSVVAFLAAICSWLLIRLLVAPAAAMDRQLRAEMADWREALVNDRSGHLAHNLVHWPRRVLHEVESVLLSSGNEEAADVVQRGEARCREAASVTPTTPRIFSDGNPSVGQLGLAGYVVLAAPTRSGQPLRRFSAEAGLQKRLSPAWAERLARLLHPLDLVRLLHTPRIEHQAMVGMLWLRAAFVLVAPLTGPVSLTGRVPLAGGSGVLAQIVYWTVAIEALGMAVLAPRIARYVMGRSIRWPLLLGEQAMALALVYVSPCWASAIYAAGPAVWFEKREWTLWKIPVWAAVNLGALIAFANSASAAARLGEAAIALAVVALIADSYGLMLPAVSATLLRSWQEERVAQRSIAARAAWARSTMRSAIAEAGAVLREAAESPGDRLDRSKVDDLLRRLTRADASLQESPADRRGRPRTLADVCAQAIAGTGVSPTGWDSGASLHATQIDSRPKELGRLELASAGTSRKLERLIKRLVFEAVAHGAGLLSTRIELLDNRVVLTLANEIHPERVPGSGTGHTRAEQLATSLPDTLLDTGQEEEFNGLRMWVVRVRLGGECFGRQA